MSFLRHREIYPSDGGAAIGNRAPAHRQDEFPAGYSLAVCSPAGTASASPAAADPPVNTFALSRVFQRTVNCVLTGCLTSGGHPKESILQPARQLLINSYFATDASGRRQWRQPLDDHRIGSQTGRAGWLHDRPGRAAPPRLPFRWKHIRNDNLCFDSLALLASAHFGSDKLDFYLGTDGHSGSPPTLHCLSSRFASAASPRPCVPLSCAWK